MNSKMQAVLILPLSPTFRYWYSPSDLGEFDEISGKFVEDLMMKLKIDFKANLKLEDKILRNETVVKEKKIVHGDDEYETKEKEEEEEEEEEEEFSFDCTNPNASPVPAEDVFENGQIRSMFPIFNRDILFVDGYDGASPLRLPLKKLFIQRPGISTSSAPPASKLDELGGAPEGPYCDFSGKAAAETSSERCKKSNSTGFSKLWRFHDLFRRSNYDGKDALLLLNSSSKSNCSKETEKVKVEWEKTSSDDVKNVVVKKVKAPNGAKFKTASSSLEKYYVMNRVKEESDKRRSHLPYKVGFFTNVKRRSRNVHPYRVLLLIT